MKLLASGVTLTDTSHRKQRGGRGSHGLQAALQRSEAVETGGGETTGFVSGFDEEKQQDPGATNPGKPKGCLMRSKDHDKRGLERCFSPSLTLWPFNAVPQGVLTPTINYFCCYFITVIFYCYES